MTKSRSLPKEELFGRLDFLAVLVFGGWQSEQGGKKLANFDGHFKEGKKVTGEGAI